MIRYRLSGSRGSQELHFSTRFESINEATNDLLRYKDIHPDKVDFYEWTIYKFIDNEMVEQIKVDI